MYEPTNNRYVDKALNEIDAAMFSGDVFDTDTAKGKANLQTLVEYAERWLREAEVRKG